MEIVYPILSGRYITNNWELSIESRRIWALADPTYRDWWTPDRLSTDTTTVAEEFLTRHNVMDN